MAPMISSGIGDSKTSRFCNRWLRTMWMVLSVLALLWFFGWGSTTVQVLVDLQSDAGADGQIFYAQTGQGYTPDQSVNFVINPDGKWHTYRIEIPHVRDLTHLRVDPGSASGSVEIRRITVTEAGYRDDLTGGQLSAAVEVTNSMGFGISNNSSLRFIAVAPDPYVSFNLPNVTRSFSQKIRLGRWLGATALTAAFWLLLAELVFPCFRQRISRHNSVAGALEKIVIRVIKPITLLVPLTFAAVWGMAGALGLGCPSTACMSSRSLEYGTLLTLAMLAFAVVGASVLSILNKSQHSKSRSALLLWIVVGQVCLLLYVYLRSLLDGIVQIPLTRGEIFIVVGACLLYLINRTDTFQRIFDSPEETCWIFIKIAALAAIAVWISDRELPRLVMLSSDPDVHEFFAKQVERLGAIPRMPVGWHVSAFGYPAGSPVLIYIWSLVSGLNVGNALAALPLLQCLTASLLIVEVVSTFTESYFKRFVLLIAVLGMTFAGFLFPLYERYSHMEGVGRQESEGLVALACLLLLAYPRLGISSQWVLALLMAVTIFSLGTLNPINVVIPSVLIGSFVVFHAVTEKRLSPVILAPFVAILFLMLDPYYASLLSSSGSEAVQKVGLATNLRHLTGNEILRATGSTVRKGSEVLRLLVTFSAASTRPSFLVIFLSFSVLLVVSIRYFNRKLAITLAAIFSIIILWLVSSVFSAVQSDTRFYLLAPYFEFSLTQYKIALLTLMAGFSVVVVRTKNNQFSRPLLVALVVVLLVVGVIRPEQKFRLEPRFDYCGSMGCSAPSDIVVMQEMKGDTQLRTNPGKILVPNSINQMGAEKWLFPVDGARLLPEYTEIPLAFYYYYGDSDYTTASYETYVCKKLDRAWLLSKNIRYIFLPANRVTACVSSMETLPHTEHIIASSGNSYLLELR
jgi:hypothetical protein